MFRLSKTANELTDAAILLYDESKDAASFKKNLVNIVDYEIHHLEIVPELFKRGFRKKKPNAGDYLEVTHIKNMRQIFADKAILSRSEIVAAISKAYEVGRTKVELSDGYLNWLIAKMYIKKEYTGCFSAGAKCADLGKTVKK